MTANSVLSFLPGAQVIKPASATLLGSPLGGEECVSTALEKKINDLAKMEDRLSLLTAHDSLLLLYGTLFLFLNCCIYSELPLASFLLASPPMTNNFVQLSAVSVMSTCLPPIQPGLKPLFQ